MDGGFVLIKPVLKLMLGFWIGSLVLSLIYQLLTRAKGQASPQGHRKNKAVKEHHYPDDQDDYSLNSRRTASTRSLNREERIARDELLHEEPIRAIR